MPTQKELIAIVTPIAIKLYGPKIGKGPWKQTTTDPLDLSNGPYSVYFSKKESGRILSIVHREESRMKPGPRPGEKFRTKSEWEEYAFQQVAKVWGDVDGYVGGFRKIGYRGNTNPSHKSWYSDSSHVSVIWFTHPIRGLRRQFSCTMDMATGAPVDLACSPYHPAPAKLIPLFDNSKKRKVKIGPPPIGLTVDSFRKTRQSPP